MSLLFKCIVFLPRFQCCAVSDQSYKFQLQPQFEFGTVNCPTAAACNSFAKGDLAAHLLAKLSFGSLVAFAIPRAFHKRTKFEFRPILRRYLRQRSITPSQQRTLYIEKSPDIFFSGIPEPPLPDSRSWIGALAIAVILTD